MKPTLEILTQELTSYIQKPCIIKGRSMPFVLSKALRSIKIKLEGPILGLDYTFGFITVNPNKDNFRKSFNLLYVTESDNVNNLNTSLPSKEGYEHFLNLIINQNDIKDIYLVGKRGAGKSFVQNKLINVSFKEKLIPNGITYFRADVAKLHKLNYKNCSQTSMGIDRMTISQYMALHAFFVVLSSNTETIDPALHKFHDDKILLKQEYIRYSTSIDKLKSAFCEALALEKNNELLVMWGIILDSFKKRNLNSEEEDEDLISYLISSFNQIKVQFNNYDELMRDFFHVFINYLNQQQSIANKILPSFKVVLIVDGVDNLRTDDFLSATEYKKAGALGFEVWYGKYLQDIKNMRHANGYCQHVSKTIFALRDDTFNALGHDPVESHRTTDQKPLNIIDVLAPDAIKAFEKKLAAIEIDPTHSLFNKHQSDHDKHKSSDARNISSEIKELFKIFVDKFFDAHLKNMPEFKNFKRNNSKLTVSEVVFNNNGRIQARSARNK
jgi:ABC-type dipeptide/oligopeptide/nickel transport system ATPase component